MKISEMVKLSLESNEEEKNPNFLRKSISTIKTHKKGAGIVGSGLGLAALSNYHPKTAGVIGLTAGGLGYLHHRYLNKKAKQHADMQRFYDKSSSFTRTSKSNPGLSFQ
jgi:hypothetical protein